MSIRLEVFDAATPMLEKIMQISYGMALESLSVAGAKVQSAARKALKSKSHNWHQLIDLETHKRKIFKDMSQARELGRRMSYDSGGDASPNSMANMITSNLIAKHLTVVIGGKHKSFQPRRYKDGKDQGSFGGRVKGVGVDTFGILHKLNAGERNQDHNWAGSKKSMKGFELANYQAYNFMEEGAMMAQGAVLAAMTTRYESLLHKAVNNANIRVVKRNIG